jgi:hypothetical protein
MTDNITLPRAVAERIQNAMQFLVDALEFDHDIDALAALDAALEAQEDEALLNEPVAMRYDGDGYGYLYIDSGSGSDWQRRHKDAEPLYLAPPQPDTTREPATDEQVAAAYKANYDNGWFPLIFFDAWREAERHHGIRKENGK